MNSDDAAPEVLSTRGMRLLGLMLVLATGLLYAVPRISYSSLRLLDVDGYMRAQRVVDLMSGENSWFDSWVYRANAPFGHALHWTRPVDAILVVLSWPFTLFQSLHEAVFLGSFGFGLVMIVGLFFGVAWTARAVTSRGGSYLAGAATALQLGLVSYNSPGHPDHHGLILLMSVLLIGHTLRLLQTDNRGLALRAGAVAGLGLWVATEFLFPLAVCLVALVVKWMSTGDRLESLRHFAVSLLGSLILALALERPTSTWFDFQADRLSILHVIMATFIVLAVLGMGRFAAGGLRRRLVATVVGGGAIAALLQWIFPGFFLGPVVAIPAAADRFFDAYVTELLSTWHSVGEQWVGFVLLLGAPALALGQALERAWASRRTPLFSSWLLILGWLASSLGLAILSFRYVPLAEVLVGVPLVAGVEQWLRRRQTTDRIRALLIVWPLVGYLVLVVAASAFGSESELTPAGNCGFETIEATLSRELPTGQPVVLAAVPYGPELLWRLPVAVVGSPYHTNPDGIEFTETVFRSASVDSALASLNERGIDAIVVCEGEAASSGYLSSGSFYKKLLAGEPLPGWRQLPPVAESPFRVYLKS